MLCATEDSRKTKKSATKDIQLFAFFTKAGTGDIAMMTRQLAALVRAGIPLVDSIAALNEQLEKEDLKRIMTAVRGRLNEGTGFRQPSRPTRPPSRRYTSTWSPREKHPARSGVRARSTRRLYGGAGSSQSKVSAALAYLC
ncbi:MAG: type II secretion system F family protein [Polyangiaceae bacterium]